VTTFRFKAIPSSAVDAGKLQHKTIAITTSDALRLMFMTPTHDPQPE